MSLPERKIYSMAYSVPLVEVLGYTVEQVQGAGNEHRWFMHRGIWFDATDPRCERYCLYELPFFNTRCLNVRIFDSSKSIQDCLTPFKDLMLSRYNASPEGKRGEGERDDEEDDEEAGDDVPPLTDLE
jgi:hypothetical protein